MNWEFIFSAILAMGLFFVVLLTLGFYVSYRRDKALANRKVILDPAEGRYFRRFIPKDLRPLYKEKLNKAEKDREAQRAEIISYRALYAVPIVIFVLSGAYLVFKHGHKFKAPTQLTQQELKDLPQVAHQWQQQDGEQSANWEAVLKGLRSKTLIFVRHNKDQFWTSPGSTQRVADQIYRHWYTWANGQELKTKECSWQKFKSCNLKNSIVIVPMGQWDLSTMNKYLQKGQSFLVIGPPTQLYKQGRLRYSWKELEFVRKQQDQLHQLVLKGDQILTLGWAPGKAIKLPAVDTGYVLHTSDAQAYRMSEDRKDKSTAWYAKSFASGGRLVWVDHMPNVDLKYTTTSTETFNALQAHIFRYLQGQPYSALATWPEAKDFVYSLTGDIEDQYQKVDMVLEVLEKHKAPVSWYSVARMAEEFKTVTKKMAKLGLINCQGETHNVFANQKLGVQTNRLAICKKILRQFSKSGPLGLRPPEEKWDASTRDAATNTSYEYMFVGRLGQLAPQIFISQLSQASVVLIPRENTDDYLFFGYGDADEIAMKNTFKNELAMVQDLGGHYVYDFHSQFLDRKGHVKAIDYLMSTAQTMEGSRAMSIEELSEWWRVKYSLNNGVEASAEQFKKFKPVLLEVNGEGQLSSTPYRAQRQVSNQ